MAEHQQISSKRLKFSSIEDNNGSSLGEEENEDRLSSLPDSIIADILSLLDIPSAIATSVVSHRWRYLWTQVTRLDIDYDDFDSLFSHEDLTVSNVSSTVDHIIRQCSSQKLNSFLLCISKPFSEEEFETVERYLISWITLICARFPDVFKVDVFDPGMRRIDLPISVFQSASLSKLELTGPFACEFPDNLAINLPYLKALVLNFPQIAPVLVSKLTKSCPLLEFLDLYLNWVEKSEVVMNISVPNLKSLVVFFITNAEEWKPCKFVIDAPKLERVNLRGHFACYHIVNNRNTLMQATLGFNHYSTFEVGSEYFTHVAKFLQQISSVESIHLVNGLKMFNPVNCVVANVWKSFRNVTKICLIYASLHQVMYSDSPIPACLLAKVKWMKLDDLKGDEYDLRLLEYILSKAEVLEEISVDVDVSTVEYLKGSQRDKVWWELNFCKRLFGLPRKSSTCEIKFSGSFVDSSSKDYCHGSIVCRLQWGF